ncbi:MAG: amidohydrolase family protein, partial [Clostridia bacterium]
MIKAKHLNKIISAHCEDNSLLNGGYINYSDYSILHGHKGISSESEWKQIERDVEIAKETGCKYHVCHISTKESVYIIADAKARGVDITCETAPHYLLLCDKDLQDDGRYKMNPPLRSEEDRLALIDGLKNGTIDMIATDHAPHSLIEKSGGLKDSLMGISGIETSFALLYTELVKKNIITLEKLIELMSINPSNRFNIKNSGFTVFSLDEKYKIASENFISNGKSTPFDGFEVFGKCKMTVCGGKIVWKEN